MVRLHFSEEAQRRAYKKMEESPENSFVEYYGYDLYLPDICGYYSHLTFTSETSWTERLNGLTLVEAYKKYIEEELGGRASIEYL